MSAQNSPDGSPAGATFDGQGTMSGEMLAMRMIQATEAAASAAQAATQAVSSMTAGSSGAQPTEWYKVFAKAFDV